MQLAKLKLFLSSVEIKTIKILLLHNIFRD
jgi:hypothetical protein